MSDLYLEEMVKRRKTTKDMILRALLMGLTGVLVLSLIHI